MKINWITIILVVENIKHNIISFLDVMMCYLSRYLICANIKKNRLLVVFLKSQVIL